MKYIKKSRSAALLKSKYEEPLNGVANLFDVSLVFIVAILLTLMSTYQVLDFFNQDSEITVMKKVKDQWQIITKKGKDIKVKKVTNRKIGGNEGFRLGTAYQLKNGRIVYIPEETINEID